MTKWQSVLTVNAGSSTVKLDLFKRFDRVANRTASRTIEGNGNAPDRIAAFLAEAGGIPAAAIHRVVHGGHRLSRAATADAAVEAAIREAVSLAPLHNPVALDWLTATRAALPAATQIVVPDTGFFADLPHRAARYPLPRRLSDDLGIRRFGFHGIAHAAMVRHWEAGRHGPKDTSRIISMQLGSGCSIAAIRDGNPVDVSMGFTPLEGLMMATRSGDIDPGIVIYLMREHGYGPDDLECLLNEESGLLGVGGNGDVKDLLQSATPEAEEAVELFCYRAAKYVGAYMATLGGVDAILIGGGIGENSPRIRERILDHFRWAGIAVDPDASRENTAGPIHARNSAVEIHVIAVDEASEMVRQSGTLLD